MANLVDTLTASGGTEPAGFLNDIVEQLWPNINIAAGKIVKDVVDPILASTLPGPLSSIHFVKIDLGRIPLRFSHVDVHKTPTEGIKLDMDLDWQGVCDIELDGNNVPKIGIEKVQLKGRVSILLGPLLNVVPLIGAAQVAFINPPELSIDFTDAASIADSFLIKKVVRNTILGVIEGMAVLPNRFLVKLDATNDYFKTYHPHHGIVRLTIGKATGITAPKKTGASRLLQKIVKDVPDCYVKVKVGAEAEWRTKTLKNDHDPEWNETHDFLVADYEQAIFLDIQDDDLAGDDDIGLASTTVKDVLLNGGRKELSLTHKGEVTESKLNVQAQFYNFVADAQLLTSPSAEGTGDQTLGLITILIASAGGLQGQREDLSPSVKITWGAQTFQTAVKTYTPGGADIFNPSFDQAFRIPLTAALLANPGSFTISLLNKTETSGSVEVLFEDVLSAPGLVKEESFEVGGGAVVRASILAHGIQLAQ